MIFFLFFTFFSASRIEPITREKYANDIMQGKDKNRVWVLLLYTPFCKKYRETYSALEQAQVLTNGTIKFGTINCQGESILCQTFKVTEYPTLIFRNKTMSQSFSQEAVNPKAISKNALQMIPTNNVQTVDDFWIDDLRDYKTPTAILFTSKTTIPGYWAALSRTFPPKKIRFGICNDEGLYSDYNITSTPSIVFYNSTHEVVFESMRKVRFLKEAVLSFLQKRENKAPLMSEFYVNAQFPEICYDYTISCVFSYENFVDPKLDGVRAHFKNDPFRFFVGNDRLFPFGDLGIVQRGEFVIFNAKKNAVIVVKELALLSAALDRVIDGGAKWTPLKAFKHSAEL